MPLPLETSSQEEDAWAWSVGGKPPLCLLTLYLSLKNHDNLITSWLAFFTFYPLVSFCLITSTVSLRGQFLMNYLLGDHGLMDFLTVLPPSEIYRGIMYVRSETDEGENKPKLDVFWIYFLKTYMRKSDQ